MQKTLAQLAKFVGGEIIGDGETIINSAATLESAGKNQITFLANKKYEKYVNTTKASVIIVNKEFTDTSASLLICDDPYFAFREIVVLLHGHKPHKQTGISDKAAISDTAKIGKNCNIHNNVTIEDGVTIGDDCNIYPGVYIGTDTTIGNGCIIYPNTVVCEKCIIGNNVTIYPNVTIGEDGFGYATHDGAHHKIPHIGNVIIEDDVEIGSGCEIERGALDSTIIGKGTKMGDHVAIGHGVKIGAHCLIVPKVGVAGSTTVGHHCVIGGQTGILGHLKIGNFVQIGGRSGVVSDASDGEILLGSPAIEASKAKRVFSLVNALPKLKNNIKRNKKRIDKLEKSS